MICGTLIQTVILAWVTFRTDWTKEVTMRFPMCSYQCFIDLKNKIGRYVCFRWKKLLKGWTNGAI